MSGEVSELDVKRALLLVRDLRAKAVVGNIHPVAFRIALKYALKVDDVLSKQILNAEQEKAIDVYVGRLLEVTPKG